MEESTRKGKGSRRHLIATPIVATVVFPLITILVLLATASKPDHFQFLGDHRPFLTGVFPLTGAGAVHGFTDEYRVYSWKEDFEIVKASAGHELSGQRFTLVKSRKPTDTDVYWSRHDGCSVWIEARRSSSRQEAFNGKGAIDSRWVTVISSNPIPNTWLSHLRYVLEPND